MTKIITTSELQKNIGKVAREVTGTSFIVTNRGKAHMIVVPYFEESEDLIIEYLERYQMEKNKDMLQEGYRKSSQSGQSSLVV